MLLQGRLLDVGAGSDDDYHIDRWDDDNPLAAVAPRGNAARVDHLSLDVKALDQECVPRIPEVLKH